MRRQRIESRIGTALLVGLLLGASGCGDPAATAAAPTSQVEDAAEGRPATDDGPSRTLAWPDLIPAAEPFDDPFAALEPAQLRMLANMVRVRTLAERKPDSVTDAMHEEADRYEAELVADGVDVEGLLAQRAGVREKRKSRATSVVTDLDGVAVRIPGYLLPLEYEADKVVEFLLVPWVGACIHTPPPAPNQIVHVRLAAAIAYPGYFKPIWSEGLLSTQGTAKELFHVDGRAVVPTAYSMRRASVSAYEE